MTDVEVQREIDAIKAMFVTGLLTFDEAADRVFELGVKFANECIQEQIIDEVSEERNDP